jgi:hypothetical protein
MQALNSLQKIGVCCHSKILHSLQSYDTDFWIDFPSNAKGTADFVAAARKRNRKGTEKFRGLLQEENKSTSLMDLGLAVFKQEGSESEVEIKGNEFSRIIPFFNHK